MLASGTSEVASASSATATGWPWKFPPESTSSSSGNTIGLSETAFASTSRTPRTNRSTSRVAPFTCGEHRSEYASCTRCVLSRCDATIGLPSSSLRRFDADATTPGCGRSAVSRSSNTRSEPSAASTLIAAVTSAVRTSRSARETARIPIASIPCVPLTSARPSLALSSSGSSPAERRTSPAGLGSPSTSSSPRPTSGSARFASGARSPDAPSEPCSGTTGIRSRFSISTIRSTTSARTPECPSASTCARSSSIARASSRESGGPTAVACERTIPSWSASAWSGSMRWFASEPNPVVTP